MFPKALQDGLMIFATDRLELGAEQAERFAELCNSIDSANGQYDLCATRMSGGQHPVPNLRTRLDRALREGTRRVRHQQQHDLANSSSGTQRRNPFRIPVGVPGAQRLPAPGVRVVNRGEGGAPVPSAPASGAMASYNAPGRPSVTALPNNMGTRYIQPGSNTSAPLAANPSPPTTTKSVSDVTSGANAGAERKVMNPDGQMVDVSQMSDQDLEAARQMHSGLGNSREVAVIEQEIKNRGPRGYA